MRNWRAVFALFFLSGIAGLVYQVLWLRRLSLVFGVTVYAASTVLAAFMAGLAIGSLLAGRILRGRQLSARRGRQLSARLRRLPALQAFGVVEILVGVTGLASPLLLEAASTLYQQVHRAAPESLEWLTVARLVCSFAILAVPTTLMGMTLPLLSAAVTSWTTGRSGSGNTGSSIGVLYAVNTAGAMVGTLATGYYLIPAIGIQRAFLAAATTNVLVGAMAWWLGRQDRHDEPAAVAEADAGLAPEAASPLFPALYWVVAVSGFASLGLEVLWFRLMLQFVTATAQAFTAMLATVLAGIAIGGLLAAQLLRRRSDLAWWLTITQAVTGLLTLGSMSFLLWTVENGWDTMTVWRAVAIAILPPSIAMGVGFSLALGAASRAAGGDAAAIGVGDRIGRLYAVNVAGAIAGSLCAGFVLLPWLGAMNALVALAALYVASAALLAFLRAEAGNGSPLRRLRRPAIVLLAMAIFAITARDVADPFEVAIDRRYGNLLPEFWRDEGAQTAVSVRATRLQHVLYLDGLHQANDQAAMVKLHRTLGHLPMVLHGSPRDVLVVGMGGGATPGAISQHAGAQVQVVELSKSVLGAAPFFAHVNYDLLNQPNVAIRIDDGRSFLTFTDRRFDVITADVIQPGHAGAGHVYSREYFSLVRRALKPGGVVLQWIGKRPSVEYKLIMRTFLEVFPHATLWNDGEFMAATVEPMQIDPLGMDRMRAHPATREALDAIGLTGFDVLRSWYTAGPGEMRTFVGAGPVLTDDRPLVEYHHWLPPASAQPPLDLTSVKGDVSRVIAGGGE
jgi:spermidine synthase